MKYYLSLLVFALTVSSASAEYRQVDLTIFGMDCALCAHSLRVSLGAVDGVQSVDVSINKGVASIVLKQGNQVTLERLRGVVKSIGFLPKDIAVKTAGTIDLQNDKPVFRVTGTSEAFNLELEPSAKKSLNDVKTSTGKTLILDGIVPAIEKKASPRLLLRDFVETIKKD